MSTNDLPLTRQAQISSPATGLRATDLRAAFDEYLNPADLLEQTLVDEVARRAAQMADFDVALTAFRREGETSLLSILSATPNPDSAALEAVTASVLASERHQALLRQGLASARGFGRAVRELHDLRDRSQAHGWNSVLVVDPRFGTEPACWAHLVRRYVRGDCGCGACGAVATGSFIAARLSWQCGRCRAQTGLRVGTCMARSAIPLTKWFAAIRAVLLTPSVTAADLASFLEVKRHQTVRTMAQRISAAARSENASAQLAGLDKLYLAQLS